jgi:hypothetical protein
MGNDPRDEIWGINWKQYYEAFYQEVFAEKIGLTWQRVDEISKVIIALTVSGSAISGWALWNDPQYKMIWTILAGIGALLSITNKSFDISKRVVNWTNTKNGFFKLRIKHEMLMNKMKINTEFNIEEMELEIEKNQTDYAKTYESIPNDSFINGFLKKRTQKYINLQLTGNKEG